MDIALVLSKIRPNAKWRMADTYAHLQKTWEDEEQKIPTIEELEQAWNEILEEQSKNKEYETNYIILIDGSHDRSYFRSQARRECNSSSRHYFLCRKYEQCS